MASTLIKTSAAPRLASSLSGVAETVTRPYEQASRTSSRAERVRARASLDVGDCRAWALAPLTIESVNNVNRSGVLTALEASLGNEQVIITTITSIEPVYHAPAIVCVVTALDLPHWKIAIRPSWLCILLALNATVTNGLFELERPLGTPCHASRLETNCLGRAVPTGPLTTCAIMMDGDASCCTESHQAPTSHSRVAALRTASAP